MKGDQVMIAGCMLTLQYLEKLLKKNLAALFCIDSSFCMLIRGVGTGPAGPATAEPKFPEPTIKNIIPLFAIKQIRKFCITIACLHRFNKGIILLYYRKNKTLIFFKPHLHYELGACKNNSRSLREMLSNKLPRHFYWYHAIECSKTY